MKQSISQLAELTGMDRRTVVRRLVDLPKEVNGRSHSYESKTALPILYGHGKKDDESYDLTEERARLAHHQANIAALDEQVKEKTLIPAEVVKDAWQSIFANVRARVLSIPTTLAASCANASRDDVENKASELVRQALEELVNDVDY